jgi:tRNA-dihydrouridine synthase B
VRIPVFVNGEVKRGADCVRALAVTGCAGVMIGGAAIAAPWIFGEARALLAGQPAPAAISTRERLACYQRLAARNVVARGEDAGIQVTRRHLSILGPLAASLRSLVVSAPTLAELDERLAAVRTA